eukprot:5858447-Prymnesium_polylepis.1
MGTLALPSNDGREGELGAGGAALIQSAPRRHQSGWIDYSSGRARQVRSIYHVSWGTRPLYDDGDAVARTGGHGLSL